MYYYLTAGTNEAGLRMKFSYQEDHRARSFYEGIKFSDTPGAKPWNMPPTEPIIITIDPDPSYAGAPFPTFIEVPIPFMCIQLQRVLSKCGVHMDCYEAELRYHDGRFCSSEYVVFNLLDLIPALDLKQSKRFESTNNESGFRSITLDENKTKASMMFRLMESPASIFVHQKVKDAIEKEGIPLIRFHDVGDIALL